MVLWASHFTNLYEDALGSEAIHGFEHVLYLTGAVLFWRPVIGLETGPSRLSHPGRIEADDHACRDDPQCNEAADQ